MPLDPTSPEIPMSRTKLAFLALSLVVAAGLSARAAYAETRTAADLTPEAVWAAIDAAKDGDTVVLPAGKAEWTKGWNAGHGAKMKAITIRGAGMDKTVIGDNRSHRGGDNMPFWLIGLEGKPFRVTGITFDARAFPMPESMRAWFISTATAETSASITASSKMPTTS